jgi:hypothetical protein
MVWRFQAINVFLTYPQCNISKERCLELFKAIRPVKDYCIAEESHQDGTPHIHAWLSFTTKCNTQDPLYFDLVEAGRTFHPNIQKPRSIKSVQEYITKDENYIHSEKYKDLTDKLDWSQMGVDVSTTAEFLQKVLANHPKEYWLNYQKLKETADLHFTPKVNIYDAIQPEQPFLTTALMDQWVNEELPKVSLFHYKLTHY